MDTIFFFKRLTRDEGLPLVPRGLRGVGRAHLVEFASRERRALPAAFAAARSHRGHLATWVLVQNEARIHPLFASAGFFHGARRAIVVTPGACAVTARRGWLRRLAWQLGRDAWGHARGGLMTLGALWAQGWRPPSCPPLPERPRQVLCLRTDLITAPPTGGSTTHTCGVVDALAAAGVSVTLAAHAPFPVSAPIRFCRLPPPPAAIHPEATPFALSWSYARALRAALSPPPDIVYQRLTAFDATGALLARAYGVPLVLEYNGSEEWMARSWGQPLRWARLARYLEGVQFRAASRVVCVSEALREDLLARGVAAAKVVAAPNGVDPERFAPTEELRLAATHLRRRLAVSPEALLVGHVGSYGPWHGVEVMAAALPALLAHDERVRLVFAGAGTGLERLRQAAARSGRPERVIFTGILPGSAIPALLSALDVCLSPQVRNADGTPFFGSPTKLFEYMAAGRAIVASDLDQLATVLRPDGADPCGLLVPPGDSGALTAAVVRLLDDAELRARLGGSARAAAVQRHSWARHVEEAFRPA